MKHRWRFLGAGAGWEVYRCATCGDYAIPSPLPFGPFWPDLLRWFTFGILGRCRGA